MTAVIQPSQLWSSMPGWGIVTDLTPPELIASRRLKIVRRVLGIVLALILVLLMLGYGYANLQSSSADSALSRTQDRTSQLQAQQSKYGAVTLIRGSIDAVQRKVATAMSADVDFNTTLGQFRKALPADMTITEVDLAISPTGAVAAAGSLDTSQRPQIGKVKLIGSAHNITDLSRYVSQLQLIPGVVDLLPVSNQVSGLTVQYAVTLSLTDQVLSHHYDVTGTGSK